MTLTIGSKLAHYQITAKIGEGGMGIVYKAKDSHLDRFVAIKVLPPERVSDPTRKARFVQEAKAASALNHPNIITIYDIDQQDGVDFMVMEYIPGKTLDEMIPRKGMKLGDALKYAVQISDALSRAHGAGIIHRDLKPGNIMVDEHGHVKVLDFGLAKLTEVGPLGEDEATRTLPTTDEGMIVGTIAYMSPEQAEGKRVDARSDIFSFGSVLYEMVTGRKAFQTDTKTSTLAALINKEPEPLGAEIPYDLEKIIKRCLQKDITRRFQHMDDIKIALQELKEESDSGKLRATQAASAVPISKGVSLLTGRRILYIFAGLLILVVAYLAFNKYYLKRPSLETEQVPTVSQVANTQKSIAILPFEDISPAKDQEYFVNGLSEELQNTLSQIPDLGVIGWTSSFSFKDSNKTIPEIGSTLGVENILRGSVRKAGNELRIIAQLFRTKDGLNLWSNTYDRELKDVFEVQEDIAQAVADELKVKLGMGRSLKRLGGTDNAEAYELYLVSQGQGGETSYASLNRNLKLLDEALAIDPKFAIAWATKATTHQGLIVFGPSNRALEEQNEALSAALKAIELEPNLALGYVALGITKDTRCDWSGAESAFGKALEMQKEPLSGSGMFISNHYRSVGYFKKSHELLEEIRRNDPLHQSARAHYMQNLAFLGDMRQAEEEYKRGRELISGQWSLGDRFITDFRLSTKAVVSGNLIVYSDQIYDAIKEHLNSPKDGLMELRHLYAEASNLSSTEFLEISLGAAYFGDSELAMEVAEKSINIEGAGVFHLWYPVMREVRQTSRFKALIKKIGLVDYWNEFGWPDLCHQTDDGDFTCD